MKRLFSILLTLVITLTVDAQDSRYTQKVVDDAAAGDAWSMCELGICYYYGYGVPVDYGKAASWYAKAAEAGSVVAMNNLGVCYENGEGVMRNEKKAYECYLQAATNGNLRAMNKVGDCYKNGWGTEQDYKEAYTWYKKSADKGNPRSINNVGECYYYGHYVEQDYSQSMYWFKKAALKGNTDGMFNMGYCYHYGKGVPVDYRQALFWYNKGAEKGHSSCMNNIAYCYMNGLGVAKDNTEAFKWYKKAATLGHVWSEFYTGLFYYNGDGTDVDYNQAAYWYKKAADQGNAPAMCNLGLCYEMGNGVKKDQSRAVYWYGRSAMEGDNVAIRNLGNCYNAGNGVECNTAIAGALYEASNVAKNGDIKRAISLVKTALPDITEQTVESDNPPVLQIVPGSINFVDASGNNTIEAGEDCSLTFKVKNIGKGSAVDCTAAASTTSPGFKILNMQLKEIKPGETADVLIMLSCDNTLKDGMADIAIRVDEPNGFGCQGSVLSVSTVAMRTPMVVLADYAVSSDQGSMITQMKPFNLNLLVQNTDYGTAEDVRVSISLPDNVILFAGEASTDFLFLEPGKTKELNYSIIANNEYASATIPVNVNITEKYGKYAKSKVVMLALNQQTSRNKIVIDPSDDASEEGQIVPARLYGKTEQSDVDIDIPHNAATNTNTFAVIIANENYRRESKVMFARNDGEIFSKYCNETLGLPHENIRLLNDATLNDIRGGVNWLRGIANAYKGEANLIFYYAGHGVPDERSREAYMLPVDGYGNDIMTAYRLEDLYASLSECPSRQTLVFLDACFSGGQRSGENMSTTRSVAIRPRKNTPKGKMVVFSAAQGDETAYSYNEMGHGMFTYYLLKKIKETNGEATLGELGSYVSDSVNKRSLIMNSKSQTPQIMPSSLLNNTWRYLKMR